MEELICSIKKCTNNAECYNGLEDSYYCSQCAHAMFNPKDCTKIGSISVIKQMLGLSQDLLNKIADYVKEEELELKWKETLEQIKILDEHLKGIRKELEDTLKVGKLKDLDKVEQRSFDLKFQITESEIYKKYLFHKDMNEHRFKETKNDLNMTVAQVVRDMAEIRIDEEKASAKERIKNWRDLYESKPTINNEFEEFKRTHFEEIEQIKQKQLSDKEAYEKEKEDLLAQRIEIEQELNTLKNKSNEISAVPHNISYDVYKAIYEKFIGLSATLSPSNSITMSLNDQKWVTLLKILSNFRLPELNYYWLDYIPADSEDVKAFMINSVPTQKKFYFNINKQVQIEGSKYFESLKEVARKTTDVFQVYNTNFSAHEFCEIVSAAKSCKNLYFYYDLIPFDYECDFSAEMGECKIEYISLGYSGGSSYSNWSQNPARFENMVAAISRCEPLSKSLKTLYIAGCDITKAKAQEVLNKYKLNGIQITGV